MTNISLQGAIIRTKGAIKDYIETRVRKGSQLSPEQSRNLGEAIGRLIEARFNDSTIAKAQFEEWQEGTNPSVTDNFEEVVYHLVLMIDGHKDCAINSGAARQI